jgi:hypothetical protein
MKPPTRNQYQRWLTLHPITAHPSYAEYVAARKVRPTGPDNWGEWVRKNYPGAFNVFYSKLLNHSELWEGVWEA